MKLEFMGTYVKHETKKTNKNNDYSLLVCKEQFSNRDVRICIFNKDLAERLVQFNQGDNLVVIFETWYSKKDSKNILLIKDVVAC